MTAELKERELAHIKREMVRAHIADDGERLRELSAQKQALKKKHFCVDCGCSIHTMATRCKPHHVRHRFYRNAIPL